MINKTQLKEVTRHLSSVVDNPKNIVGYDSYPEQLSLSEVRLRYRSHYELDQNISRIEPKIKNPITGELEYGRPKDDLPEFIKDSGNRPEDHDINDVYEDTFIVLRADAVAPFRLIAISKDYSLLLINSTQGNESGYIFETRVSPYPLQINNLIGKKIYTKYLDSKKNEDHNRIGYILRADQSEPNETVIIELCDDRCRFIFENEVLCYIDAENLSTDVNLREHEIADIRKDTIIGSLELVTNNL